QEAVDLVPLRQKMLGEMSAVLAGNAGDERAPHSNPSSLAGGERVVYDVTRVRSKRHPGDGPRPGRYRSTDVGVASILVTLICSRSIRSPTRGPMSFFQVSLW